MSDNSQGVTPFLWFDGNAEQAAEYYVSVFNNSRINKIMRYGDGMPYPPGTVLTVEFTVNGGEVIALNGGPEFKFTPAISLFVTLDQQAEVDRVWDRLMEGGTPMSCGWITDKFGVTWQIVPDGLLAAISDPNPERAKKAMAAMMQQTKLDINEIRAAVEA